MMQNKIVIQNGDTLSLPKGWEMKKLGQVCELSAGADVPKNNFSKIQTENYRIPIYANGEKNNGLYGYTNISKVAKPSITVSARGTIGFSLKRLKPFFPIVRLIVVTPINLKELSLDYLDYAIRKIDFKHSGSSIPQLTVPMIRDYEIPLPPLPEQHNIVSTLNEAFSAIEIAKSNAKKNLKNAKELFESYLQNVFSQKGDDWQLKTLGEVVDFFNGYAFKSQDAVENSNTQLVRMGNLYQNILNLNRKPVFYPNDFSVLHSKYLLVENDLIISLTGTSDKEDYGYTVRIPKTNFNLLLNQRIAKISVKDEKKCDKEFLFRFLLSRLFLDELYKTANGTRQANLSTEAMKSLSIYLPSIDEQKIIVQKLDALSVETSKLEIIYKKKLNDLEELKKSILQKAFSGELKTSKLETV